MTKTMGVFDARNNRKKQIETKRKKYKRVKVGEIWICDIGVNIGNELSRFTNDNFQRPVLII